MPEIRKARPSDMANVEYVCRMTAGALSQAEPIVGNRIAKMFSTYYIRQCADTCFVLADDNDKAVGYVLCEPDFKRFRRDYRKKDVRSIMELDLKSGLTAWFFPIPYTIFGGKYPAHLHIDILPQYQSQGYGAKMMETLLNELKLRKVKGVMLCASAQNDGAIRFYKRLGFKVLISAFGETAMGKEL